MDDTLRHYERLAHKNVTIRRDQQGREDTYMNNSNDTQHSGMQEDIIIRYQSTVGKRKIRSTYQYTEIQTGQTKPLIFEHTMEE